MDPNEALRRAREATRKVFETIEGGSELRFASEDLAEAFEALDGWLSKGGFLPESWAR